jgi:hypothetical protein
MTFARIALLCGSFIAFGATANASIADPPPHLHQSHTSCPRCSRTSELTPALAEELR